MGCGEPRATHPGKVAYLVHVAVDLPAQEMTFMATDHELRFNHLFHAGRPFVFPCDAKGRVDQDSWSTRARNNYFFARALVGLWTPLGRR